jgi:hypothetical protein
MNNLAQSVLAWWEANRHNTVPLEDGDEDNVYDETPAFVRIAQEEQEELTQEEVEFIASSMHDKLNYAISSCKTPNEQKWLIGHTSFVHSLIGKFVRISLKNKTE